MPENNQRQISEAEALNNIYRFINSSSGGDLNFQKHAISKLEPKTEYGPHVNAVINIAKGKVNAQDIAHLSENQKKELMAFSDPTKPSDPKKPATDLNGGAGFLAKIGRNIASRLTNLVYPKADPVESLLKEIEHDNKYDIEKLHKLESNGGHYIYNAAATTNIGMTGMKAAIDQSNAIWDQTVTDLKSSAKQSKTKADDHHQAAIGTFLRHAQGYQSDAAEKAAEYIINNSPDKDVTKTMSYNASIKGVSIIGLTEAEKREVETYSTTKSNKMHVLSLGDSPDVMKKTIQENGNSSGNNGIQMNKHITQWLNDINKNIAVKNQHTDEKKGENKEDKLLEEAEDDRRKYYDPTRLNIIAKNLDGHLQNSKKHNHEATALENLAEVVAANHSSRAENNP